MNALVEFRKLCDPRVVPLSVGLPFFCRKALKIRVLSGSAGWQLVPFELNDEQMQVVRVLERDAAAGRGSRIIVLKSRKLGISTLVQALQFYTNSFLPAQAAVVMAHIDEATQELARIAETMSDNVPDVLAPFCRPTRYHNTLTWPNGSRMRIATQGSDDRLRGSSPSCLHMSEVGLWHKKRAGTTGDEPIQASLGALETSGELPAPGTVVVMESTAKGSVGPFYNRWQSAQHSAVWTPLFFPWQTSAKHQPELTSDDVDLLTWAASLPGPKAVDAWMKSQDIWATEWCRRRHLLLEWAKRAVDYSLTPAQVRWALMRCEEQGSLEVFDEEYPLSPQHAFMASGHPVLKAKDVEHITEPEQVVRCGPLGKLPRDQVGAGAVLKAAALVPGEAWQFYRLPEPGWSGRYIVTADASGGTGQDYACLQVWDRVAKEQAAEFMSTTTSPPDLAQELETACRLYHGAMAVPEVNNHGHAVLAVLWDRGYRSIYRRQIRDRFERMERADEPSLQYGWETTPTTRTVMMEHLVHEVRERRGVLHSARLRNQLLTLVRDRKERIDHAKGEHDDAVVALAIALQVQSTLAAPTNQAEAARSAARKPKPTRTNEFLGARAGGGGR